jgi:hypothetical protein
MRLSRGANAIAATFARPLARAFSAAPEAPLLKTALHDLHVELGGKVRVPPCGWVAHTHNATP